MRTVIAQLERMQRCTTVSIRVQWNHARIVTIVKIMYMRVQLNAPLVSNLYQSSRKAARLMYLFTIFCAREEQFHQETGDTFFSLNNSGVFVNIEMSINNLEYRTSNVIHKDIRIVRFCLLELNCSLTETIKTKYSVNVDFIKYLFFKMKQQIFSHYIHSHFSWL